MDLSRSSSGDPEQPSETGAVVSNLGAWASFYLKTAAANNERGKWGRLIIKITLSKSVSVFKRSAPAFSLWQISSELRPLDSGSKCKAQIDMGFRYGFRT